MKKYYGVETKFYDDGKMAVTKITYEGVNKPQDVQDVTEYYDLYVDWFEDKEMADKFYSDAMKEANGV